MARGRSETQCAPSEYVVVAARVVLFEQ